MRVIDADALKLSLMTISSDELVRYCYPCEKVLKKIDEQPTIEPERKKGHWIRVDDDRISGRCSACGWESLLYEDDVVGMSFCPNCGARMVQEGEQP